MLQITGLDQYYGESHILRDVNLEVKAGSCACLMGRNGVGKTTLLQCIMGVLPARSGHVFLDGTDLLPLPVEHRAALGVGYVPQGRQIFPLLTVRENMELSLPMRKDKARAIPAFIFDFFPVLGEMMHRRGGDLSGGQQQQLAIARALTLEPRLLILDEPTEGIQPNIVRDIATTIRRLNAEMGLTVLLVEQKVPFARRMADTYMIMDRGHIVSQGDMHGLDDATVKAFLSV